VITTVGDPDKDRVYVFKGVYDIVVVVDSDLVRIIEPVIVFVINGVGVIRVVPDKVVLAELVFELETDPEKLDVPVEVLDADMLLV